MLINSEFFDIFLPIEASDVICFWYFSEGIDIILFVIGKDIFIEMFFIGNLIIFWQMIVNN
jgi:hypothetical protein